MHNNVSKVIVLLNRLPDAWRPFGVTGSPLAVWVCVKRRITNRSSSSTAGAFDCCDGFAAAMWHIAQEIIGENGDVYRSDDTGQHDFVVLHDGQLFSVITNAALRTNDQIRRDVINLFARDRKKVVWRKERCVKALLSILENDRSTFKNMVDVRELASKFSQYSIEHLCGALRIPSVAIDDAVEIVATDEDDRLHVEPQRITRSATLAHMLRSAHARLEPDLFLPSRGSFVGAVRPVTAFDMACL
ncbi:hypothetical protein CYMTET_41602 [Cymbomonas tetramitiformis]|uniref:Uncharacterized protein n=1 Tax=Cymbomonas tetramitiformis TaxID=36881 RepID=A0AAE0C7W2_9CHLO|nr:hypothetical protein CYMTET_41602 [Cymbomonas tetramitiformis]